MSFQHQSFFQYYHSPRLSLKQLKGAGYILPAKQLILGREWLEALSSWHNKHGCAALSWSAFLKYTFQEHQQSPHRLLWYFWVSRVRSPVDSQPFGLRPPQYGIFLLNQGQYRRQILFIALASAEETQGHGGCYTSPIIWTLLGKTQIGEFRSWAKKKINLGSHTWGYVHNLWNILLDLGKDSPVFSAELQDQLTNLREPVLEISQA